MRKLVGLLMLLAAACTAPSRVDHMVGQFSTAALTDTDSRYQGMRIARADVDTKTHPVWYTSISNEALTGAARQTLDGRGLLALYPENARMELDVQMVDFRRPPMTLDEATTITMRYVVRDIATSSTIFDQTITTVGSSPFEKGVSSDVRKQAAAEQAMRQSMTQFINKLMAATGPKQPQAEPTKAKKPKLKQ